MKRSSITVLTSFKYRIWSFLTFEKSTSINCLLFTGGCNQHSVWLRHTSQTGEWLNINVPLYQRLRASPKSKKSRHFSVFFSLYLAAWGHQVLHPRHNVPLSVCFTTPQSSKRSSWLPISTLGRMVLLMMQQCTGIWPPSPIISHVLSP